MSFVSDRVIIISLFIRMLGSVLGPCDLSKALTALFPHRVRKILNLRVFEDESGKHWSKSVMDKQYEVLCVSQFTLQCVLKGNKPDFHLAMPTEQAEGFYNNFLEQLRKTYRPELIKGRHGVGV
jgi:D-tyrosyl-tRNA(Tyr) deacylase